MTIERNPYITTGFRKILSIEATSLNQTKVDLVTEICTAIQQNMDERQQENTSNAEGGTAETTTTPPEDKEEFQPEEGNSNKLHQSGSTPNDAEDVTAQGKEETTTLDEDDTRLAECYPTPSGRGEGGTLNTVAEYCGHTTSGCTGCHESTKCATTRQILMGNVHNSREGVTVRI